MHLHIPTAGSSNGHLLPTQTLLTHGGDAEEQGLCQWKLVAVAENPNLDISISHCWKKTACLFVLSFSLMLLVLFSYLGWAEVAFLCCCFSFGCCLYG